MRCLAQGTVVAPNGWENVPGRLTSSIPFRNAFANFQQIYAGNQFGSLPQDAVLITAVSFRLDEGGLGGPPSLDVVVPTLDIWLSTSARTPGTMAVSYSSNVGPDASRVFSGTNVRVTGTWVGGVNPFDVTVSFQNPFLYNRTAGSLMMLLSTTGPGGVIINGHDIDFVGDEAPGTAFVNPVGIVYEGGLVTQFRYAPVPEPRCLALLLPGLAFLALRRNRSKTL